MRKQSLHPGLSSYMSLFILDWRRLQFLLLHLLLGREVQSVEKSLDTAHMSGVCGFCLLLGTESFVFQFAIQKVKDQDIRA